MNVTSLFQRPSILVPSVLMAIGIFYLFQTNLSQNEILITIASSIVLLLLATRWLKSFNPNELFRMGFASLVTFLFTPFFGTCLGSLFSLQPGISIFSLMLFASVTFAVANSVFRTIFPDNKLAKRQDILRKIILDISALEDGRVVDLARSGLLDQRLAIPRSLPKELNKLSESLDEGVRFRARKALEAYKRIEMLPKIDLEFFDLPEDEGDLNSRLIRTAKNLNAFVLSNETPLSRKDLEDVSCISIDMLASALKPAPQRGEFLSIKVLRLGKEPKQGVGYLDDGTMVVVNGGGDFLGKSVRAQVLSQKHSSTGKIIFCNALDVDDEDEDYT